MDDQAHRLHTFTCGSSIRYIRMQEERSVNIAEFCLILLSLCRDITCISGSVQGHALHGAS